MQRVKDLAKRIQFIVDLILLPVLVIMTSVCVCRFYPSKFDLLDHGILFFFSVIGNTPFFAQ